LNRALNVIDQVEFTRAGQWLQQYCRERGYPAVSRVSDDEAGTQRMCWAVIMDDAGPCKLRFCLGADGRWQVLCYVDCAGWERFPLIPSGAGWCDIADALEAAPLHVHWSWI
jgi:hypothetical protein